MSIPLICISLLGFLCIGLGFAVSATRGKTNTTYASTVDPEDALYKIMRAHGNTIEYVPILALMIYILSLQTQASWVLWCMVLVTFFRYLFAAGMIFSATLAKPHPMRFIGALGTYLTGFALCIALFLQALQG